MDGLEALREEDNRGVERHAEQNAASAILVSPDLLCKRREIMLMDFLQQ